MFEVQEKEGVVRLIRIFSDKQISFICPSLQRALAFKAFAEGWILN